MPGTKKSIYTIDRLLRQIDLESFEVLVGNLQLLIIVLDNDLKLQFGNDNFFNLVGWSPKEVLDKDYVKRFIPTKIKYFIRNMLKEIVTKATNDYSGSNEVLTRDKGTRYVNWNAIHLRSSKKKLYGVLCMGIDITEYHSLDNILNRANMERNLLLHSMAEPVIYHDQDGRIIWANKAFLDTTGNCPDDVIGSYCHQVLIYPNANGIESSGPPRALSGNEKQQEVVQLPSGGDWLCTSLPLSADDIHSYQIMKILSPMEQLESSVNGLNGAKGKEGKSSRGRSLNYGMADKNDEVGFFSQAMQDVVQQAALIHKDRMVPVLIEGETGVGKEVIARYIHHGGGEAKQPFVDINCAAITPTIFESELFGYVRGAFTGGRPGGQKGKIALADGGTLFLDEISEIPISIQAKLLRVIQEREYFPVGGLEKRRADLRLICATNSILENCVHEGTFRKDLFYRLEAVRLYVPPLRERTDDILPLALLFLKSISRQKSKRFTSIADSAARILLSHSWPGNVRQLRNVIERVVVMWDETIFRDKHLEFLKDSSVKGRSPSSQSATSQGDSVLLPPERLDLQAINKNIIIQALALHNGNITQTASYLGLSRRSLSYKLNKIKTN